MNSNDTQEANPSPETEEMLERDYAEYNALFERDQYYILIVDLDVKS